MNSIATLRCAHSVCFSLSTRMLITMKLRTAGKNLAKEWTITLPQNDFLLIFPNYLSPSMNSQFKTNCFFTFLKIPQNFRNLIQTLLSKEGNATLPPNIKSCKIARTFSFSTTNLPTLQNSNPIGIFFFKLGYKIHSVEK